MDYEYFCEECCKEDEVIEVSQKITEDALTVCPKCGCDDKEKFYRQISKTSFILNGTGWFNKGGY